MRRADGRSNEPCDEWDSSAAFGRYLNALPDVDIDVVVTRRIAPVRTAQPAAVQQAGSDHAHHGRHDGLRGHRPAQHRHQGAEGQPDRDHQQVESAGEQFEDHQYAGCYQPVHPMPYFLLPKTSFRIQKPPWAAQLLPSNHQH
jgi:hypothetical protein